MERNNIKLTGQPGVRTLSEEMIFLPLRHVVLFPFVLTPVFFDKPEDVEKILTKLRSIGALDE